MKRREYLKEYRQKNKSKLNQYYKKYYNSKKNKNEENKEKNKEEDELKCIDLGNNNNESNDNKSDSDKSDNNKSDNDINDDGDNGKKKYIKVSYIIEEMKSLKDELETTRSLLENTNLLVALLNDELIKKISPY